jgi:hypothetical protein
MLSFLILITVVCAILSSCFASQGKSCLLALNVNMIILNLAHAAVSTILAFDGRTEFMMYYLVNIIGVVLGIRGIVRCLKNGS